MTQVFSVRKITLKPLLVTMAILGAFSTPAFADIASPEGLWWPEKEDSKYEFSFCRGDGERLCAKLVWLREDERSANNLKYLDTYLFTGMRPKSGSKWSGGLVFKGIRGKGTVVQQGENELLLKACAFTICKTLTLLRVPELESDDLLSPAL